MCGKYYLAIDGDRPALRTYLTSAQQRKRMFGPAAGLRPHESPDSPPPIDFREIGGKGRGRAPGGGPPTGCQSYWAHAVFGIDAGVAGATVPPAASLSLPGLA